MAVLALGFVGSAIGASIGGTVLGVTAATIGGFVGSAIGSMLDNMLFPQSQEGPRLSDLTVQVSSYGQPIPRIYGPENRVAGNVIWSTGLIETKSTHTQGGFKGGPSVKVTEYTYRTSVAVLIGARQIAGIKKIWANTKLIYDADEVDDSTPGAVNQGVFAGLTQVFKELNGKSHAVFDSFTVYPGTHTQLPDPTIEAYEGIGNVPAYRGSAYVVIKDLQLADYGNRLPNLEFLVVGDETITVGQICRDIAGDCGIDTNTISVSSQNSTVRGYVVARQASGTAALQPLAMAYDFDVADVAGGLRLTSRRSAMIAAIPTDYLAGHQGNEDRPEAISWTRAPETTLPREAAITHSDPARDYQVNTQTARREGGSAENNLSTELAIVLTPDEARAVADRALWERWMGRQTATTAGDDRLLFVEPGRRYAFETPAGWEICRVIRRARGANGVIELDLRRDQGELYVPSTAGAGALIPAKDLNIPGPVSFIPLDIPLLLDADDNTGFYYALVGEDGWRGADLMRSAGGDYVEVSPISYEAKVGTTNGIMADGTTTGFDDVTVLTVDMRRTSMTLTSVDDDALAIGANACFIGVPGLPGTAEIAQFGTATLVAPGRYELSHWLRGKKGTEFATSLHGAGETFVLLELGSIRRVDFGANDRGESRQYKAVALLQSPDDPAVPVTTFTNTAIGKRPYAPTALAIAGHQGTDLTLSWTRRSRLESGDLGEATEAYTLRIVSWDGVTIEREVARTTPSFVYTVAMQTADFGAPVTQLRFKVAQVSSIFGNGIFADKAAAIPA